MQNLNTILNTLESTKRMSMSHINALCLQLLKEAKLLNPHNNVSIPQIQITSEMREAAEEQVRSAFAKIKMKVTLEYRPDRYNNSKVVIDQASQQKYEEKLNAVYQKCIEALTKDQYEQIELAKKYVDDVQKLRLALIIGPSPQLSEVITHFGNNYADFLEKRNAATEE